MKKKLVIFSLAIMLASTLFVGIKATSSGVEPEPMGAAIVQPMGVEPEPMG